jgi:hypothetical protein
MKNPSRVRLSGPLQEFGPGFVDELERQGYSPIGATLQVRLMAHVSSWMHAEGLVPWELSDEVVARFLAERRAAGRRGYVTARAMAPLLAYLRELGVVPSASPAQRSGLSGQWAYRSRRSRIWTYFGTRIFSVGPSNRSARRRLEPVPGGLEDRQQRRRQPTGASTSCVRGQKANRRCVGQR